MRSARDRLLHYLFVQRQPGTLTQHLRCDVPIDPIVLQMAVPKCLEKSLSLIYILLNSQGRRDERYLQI